jgi:two-component system, NtrC family, response regulator HydG
MNLPTLLIVDDEIAHLRTLEKLFNKEGYRVLAAENGERALELLRVEVVDLVITDLVMPELDGMDLLRLVRTLQPEAEVILMTAFGTVERAVAGMKEGAYDFIAKPIKRASILKAAAQALERRQLLAENRQLKAQLAQLAASGQQTERPIIGQSAALRQALDLVRQVARSEATVLLTGESGTGKELFARMIYELSERSKGPFVAVNCAALPESIMESELFGYERGAFTGANTRRVGRFEAADGGTLLLDEVGEINPRVQVKLLRVLQEGSFERLGSNSAVQVDVRVIAATNRDLEDEIRAGNFREDLFYRLNVVRIEIPPLRHRREDIPLLAEHFLQRFRQRDGRGVRGIAREAMEAMVAYPWPGNVRELENVIERAVVLDRDGVVGEDDLPEHVSKTPADKPSGTLTLPLGSSLAEIEDIVLRETLKLAGGNKKLAAQILGITPRTIYRKL